MQENNSQTLCLVQDSQMLWNDRREIHTLMRQLVRIGARYVPYWDDLFGEGIVPLYTGQNELDAYLRELGLLSFNETWLLCLNIDYVRCLMLMTKLRQLCVTWYTAMKGELYQVVQEDEAIHDMFSRSLPIHYI